MTKDYTVKQIVYCHQCKHHTFHEYVSNDNLLLQHKEKPRPADLDYVNWYEITYSIVRCKGCHSISFLKESIFEEDFDIYNERKRTDGDFFIDYDPKQYRSYPSPPQIEDKNTYELLLDQRNSRFNHLPENIQKLQEEVILAFSNGSHFLCGIGLRMIIEAICENLDIRNPKDKKGNLQQDKDGDIIKLSLYSMIKKLRKLGLITETQKNVLNQIREMGNDTVHVLKKHDYRILFQSISIIDDLLMNIYEYNQIKLYNKNKQ